jgi:hypothetical protein
MCLGILKFRLLSRSPLSRRKAGTYPDVLTSAAHHSDMSR